MKENQKIKIIGSTDSAEVKNKKKLSYKRAEELHELMIFYGFRKDIEVEPSGMRAEEPMASNNSAEGRFNNRRAVIRY